MAPHLLGIDVGFSKTQKTTGMALLYDDEIIVYRADSTWEDRKSHLPKDFFPHSIAVDGPLLPAGKDAKTVRLCEQFFSRGPFCKRCKPGLSHFGTGFLLREAAREAVEQATGHFMTDSYVLGDRLAEAFPNLFLGVLVTDAQYAAIPKLRRGQKFDWLYDCAKTKLRQIADYVILPDALYDRLEVEEDHELRAALICLLTAALAKSPDVTKAGDSDGGWFWLPPVDLWEPWAQDATAAGLELLK